MDEMRKGKLEAAGILALYLVDFLEIHALEVFASKKQFADHHILGGEEKNAFSWFAVSSGTSSPPCRISEPK